MLYCLEVRVELAAQHFWATFVIRMLFLTFYITQVLQSVQTSALSFAVLLLQWMENMYSYKLKSSLWFISGFVQHGTTDPMRAVE